MWGNVTREAFRFSDSILTGSKKDASSSESYRPDLADFSTSDFAGIVCVQDGYLGVFAGTTNNELWRSDGTVEGSLRVDDVYTGSQGSYPSYLTSFNGLLYFAATTLTEGTELWSTVGDGSPAMIISYVGSPGIYPGKGSSNPQYLMSISSLLLFAATNPVIGRELWSLRASDGLLVSIDINPGPPSSSPSYLATCGDGIAVFAATTSLGTELWATDGTANNTFLVMDICPGQGSSNPAEMVCFRGLYYFQASDCIHGSELWVSDGMFGGNTHMVLDIRPGSAGSFPSFPTLFHSQLNGRDYLMFFATDGLYTTSENDIEGYGGSQIWRTDGSTSGTSRAVMQTENDLTADRFDMEIAFPDSMIAFNGMLLLPGSIDKYQRVKQPNPVLAKIGITQAVFVSDVDTPSNGTLELTITAGRGLIILTDPEAVLFSSSSSSLRFLLADNRARESLLLFNVLYNMGNTVDVVSTGDQVISSILGRNVTYDCLLLYAELPGIASDASQTVLSLRAANDSVAIVAFDTSVNLMSLLLGVGANYFLVQPVLTFVNDSSSFQTFASNILSLLSANAAKMLYITNIVAPGLNVNTTSLPSGFIGSSLTLNATSTVLNDALSTLFYYAPEGVYGDDTITFILRDKPYPQSCLQSLRFSPILPNVTSQAPTLCDTTTHNVVSLTLPVFVVSVNHPPVITALSPLNFTATIGSETSPPFLMISDVDLVKVVGQIPILSVLVTVMYGVISVVVQDGLVFTTGQGYQNSVVGFSGDIAAINSAVASLQYLCRPSDLCATLMQDQIRLLVDDNGFSGVGGPLTAAVDMPVVVV